MKEAIRTATALAGQPIEAEIAWKDGLPEDEKESTDIAVQRVNARISSRLAEIMRVHNLDEDAAKEMLAQIDEEASPATLGGVPQGSLDRSRQLLEGALGGPSEATPNGNPPTEPA